MKKINPKKILRFLEKRYFLIFLILLSLFLSVSLFLFYNSYLLVERKKISGKKLYFNEKEFLEVLNEIKEREIEFEEGEKGIRDIFNY